MVAQVAYVGPSQGKGSYPSFMTDSGLTGLSNKAVDNRSAFFEAPESMIGTGLHRKLTMGR
jgi:hypothetical protein